MSAAVGAIKIEENIIMDPAILTALKIHNELRARHEAPPLQLDMKLCSLAEKCAKASVLEGRSVPTPGLGLNECEISGENEGACAHDENMAREAVLGWYDHLEDYNWDTPKESGWDAFQASQIIWKSSTKLGIGIATENDTTAIIALYSPPGNSPNKDEVYRENVSKEFCP